MNSGNQKINWLIIIGFVCAAYILGAAIFSFFGPSWHPFRLYVISTIIMWFGTLICGVSLFKHHKKIGLALVAIWIFFLILVIVGLLLNSRV
jgi:MFS family permease